MLKTLRTIHKIKQQGRILALADGLQFWRYDGVIYEITTSGTKCRPVVEENDLQSFLAWYYDENGLYFFSDRPRSVIMDKVFLKNFDCV